MSALRPRDLEHMLVSGTPPLVIDLRSPREFATGSIAGARNVPWADDLVDQLAPETVGDVPIVFICAWGHRSVVATIAMRRAGFRRVAFLDGGLESWGLAGLPLSRAHADVPMSAGQ